MMLAISKHVNFKCVAKKSKRNGFSHRCSFPKKKKRLFIFKRKCQDNQQQSYIPRKHVFPSCFSFSVEPKASERERKGNASIKTSFKLELKTTHIGIYFQLSTQNHQIYSNELASFIAGFT